MFHNVPKIVQLPILIENIDNTYHMYYDKTDTKCTRPFLDTSCLLRDEWSAVEKDHWHQAEWGIRDGSLNRANELNGFFSRFSILLPCPPPHRLHILP